jgi:hypothetical protein
VTLFHAGAPFAKQVRYNSRRILPDFDSGEPRLRRHRIPPYRDLMAVRRQSGTHLLPTYSQRWRVLGSHRHRHRHRHRVLFVSKWNCSKCRADNRIGIRCSSCDWLKGASHWLCPACRHENYDTGIYNDPSNYRCGECQAERPDARILRNGRYFKGWPWAALAVIAMVIYSHLKS